MKTKKGKNKQKDEVIVTKEVGVTLTEPKPGAGFFSSLEYKDYLRRLRDDPRAVK